ncbi:uroporphyrinogen-III synthase [Phreatobacter oligotrophus]|uniref:Uroporphyrinogen-III synthase n=1 Tax=Phreatobacter oligotrophus TaxID=1122261 RepID=A0A2T4ZEY2_9HYPH|nr:uroporphyrinogen-III synthase [Phreatobacter oligotrophus]PTM60443.1 uroporphyrinogen-III synthase [Phreatobacter oligotrophus]
MRVLVTRAEPEAARTAAALAARGAEAIIAPLFAAEPVAAEISSDGLSGLLVTSPRTPRLLPSSLVAALRDRPAYAVGDRTAAALREAGFSDVRSAAGDVADLAGHVAAEAGPGATFLHAGGEDRAGDLAAALARHGVTVRTATLYRMVAVPVWPAAARDAFLKGAIDAVLHYSPRAAVTYAALAMAEASTTAAARTPLQACLSQAVAEALNPLSPPRVILAARPDEAALLAALFDAAGLPGGSPAR